MYFGQDMDGNAKFEHLQLCRLHDGLAVELHPRHVAQGQNKRQEQDTKEHQTIETEETLASQHQHVRQIEHRLHQG